MCNVCSVVHIEEMSLRVCIQCISGNAFHVDKISHEQRSPSEISKSGRKGATCMTFPCPLCPADTPTQGSRGRSLLGCSKMVFLPHMARKHVWAPVESKVKVEVPQAGASQAGTRLATCGLPNPVLLQRCTNMHTCAQIHGC